MSTLRTPSVRVQIARTLLHAALQRRMADLAAREEALERIQALEEIEQAELCRVRRRIGHVHAANEWEYLP